MLIGKYLSNPIETFKETLQYLSLFSILFLGHESQVGKVFLRVENQIPGINQVSQETMLKYDLALQQSDHALDLFFEVNQTYTSTCTLLVKA